MAYAVLKVKQYVNIDTARLVYIATFTVFFIVRESYTKNTYPTSDTLRIRQNPIVRVNDNTSRQPYKTGVIGIGSRMAHMMGNYYYKTSTS